MAGFTQAIGTPVALDESRVTFLRKTYLHLLGAIAALVAFEFYLFQSGLALRITEFILGMNWLIILAGFGVASWIARGAAQRSSSRAVQYAALGGYIAAWGILLAPVLFIAEYQVGGGVIQSAATVTLVGFGGLTGLVYFSGRDFSFLGSILRWGGFCALGLIVASVAFGFNLGIFFTVAMIGIAGGAILYDTYNILHHYPHDRYVSASLELFASIVLLFWYVLQLFTRRD